MQENTSTERQGTLTDVKHLIEFCGDNGIVSVQLSSAAVRLVETEKELRHLRHVQRVVEQATLSAPELESFPVS